MEETVILVDEAGNQIGVEEKITAHQLGLLHKAFSVFIFDSNNNILLQKRALTKYHFAGLWSNACCSHQRPGESTMEAGHRRLKEELGFDTSLDFVSSFIYKTKDPVSGLTEHEFDHVLKGIYDGPVDFDSSEVSEIKWISIQELNEMISESPEVFTFWFAKAYDELRKSMT